MSQPLFDVTFEAGWRSSPPDPRAWLQSYAVRRFGGVSPTMARATDVLYDAAYDNRDIDTSIIEDMPGSESGSRNTNASGFVAALRLYQEAFSGELDATTGPASYDLTDLTRQVLCNVFQDVYGVFVSRVAHRAPLAELRAIADVMLGVIADVDATDAADKNFLLGTWLADATTTGFNASQVSNRLFNARNQITLWGPRGEINDYAAKVGWSGLVSDYYLFRWRSHTDYLLDCIANGTSPDWGSWGSAMLLWEQAWGLSSEMYPTTPSGVAPLAQAGAMIEKYLSTSVATYTVTPGYDAHNVPVPASWRMIPGSTDKVAIGDDCPWLVKGDGSSLTACEASCESAPGCNAVNFNAATGDCELRDCVDPLHPQLTGYEGWGVWGNGSPGNSNIANAWHTDTAVLAYLCNLSPSCAGFNSFGLLVTNATTLAPSPGCTFYAKATTAPVLLTASAAPSPAATPAPTPRPLPAAPLSLSQRMARAHGGDGSPRKLVRSA